ncbi:1,4-alpha-glucan branching enzyme, partial [Bacillus cereus]|uniref:alpha amylase C-terminal domain-containing protein n=1 Tax=Bacillus cereus TaxID=1396 RepID=UPI00284CE5DD
GQFDEWKYLEDLDWNLHDFEMHRYLPDYFKAVIALYARSNALWQLDHWPVCFQWVDANNNGQSIFSFIRQGDKQEDGLVIVCNFTKATYEKYKV